jgi:acylphosphatase
MLGAIFLIDCFQLSSALMKSTFTCREVHGDLLSLASTSTWKSGFRAFVKNYAIEKGLTGSILRLPTTRAEIVIYGTVAEIAEFAEFLERLVTGGVVGSFEYTSPVAVLGTKPLTFEIVPNQRPKCARGAGSDEAFDCKSMTSSADAKL